MPSPSRQRGLRKEMGHFNSCYHQESRHLVLRKPWCVRRCWLLPQPISARGCRIRRRHMTSFLSLSMFLAYVFPKVCVDTWQRACQTSGSEGCIFKSSRMYKLLPKRPQKNFSSDWGPPPPCLGSDILQGSRWGNTPGTNMPLPSRTGPGGLWFELH